MMVLLRGVHHTPQSLLKTPQQTTTMTKLQRADLNKQLLEATAMVENLCKKNQVLNQPREEFYAQQVQKQIDNLSSLLVSAKASIN